MEPSVWPLQNENLKQHGHLCNKNVANELELLLAAAV